MIKTTVMIINKLGLHARASAKLVATASRFQSQLEIKNQRQTINGKSIMGVMMLAASQGTELTMEFNGVDEEAMEKAIRSLIEDRFGEEE